MGSASREVGALVLDDLLKYIVEDGFGIIGVVDLVCDAEDVTALTHVVVDVFVVALVRELGQLDPTLKKVSVRLGVSVVTYFSDANCSSRS